MPKSLNEACVGLGDYQQRILAWFGHYLKGEPAESWITEGKSFLERDAELKRLEKKR